MKEPSSSTLSLLYPEWQGYGEDNATHRAALRLAEALSAHARFVTVDVPSEEDLEVDAGVLGLPSIVRRFASTLRRLRALMPARVLTVGGTCGVEAAPVGYLNERYEGDLAVLWFDAHGDLNTPGTSPSGHFHGMVLRTLLGEGPDAITQAYRRPLVADQVFLIGTRALDPPERAFIADHGITTITQDEMADPAGVTARIRARGFNQVYLHLDVDVLNPTSFPDALMPTPGGPDVETLKSLIVSLARSCDVVGFSVVEYCEHEGTMRDVLVDLVLGSRVLR